MRKIFFVFYLYSFWVFSFPLKPDLNKTPGTLCTRTNPDFLELRYREQIPYCDRNVASSLKEKIYQAYGVSLACAYRYTIDHFIPLSIGGANDAKNLWPEHKLIKATRQNLEIKIYTDILKGKITQANAIKTIKEAKLNPHWLKYISIDPCDHQMY